MNMNTTELPADEQQLAALIHFNFHYYYTRLEAEKLAQKIANGEAKKVIR